MICMLESHYQGSLNSQNIFQQIILCLEYSVKERITSLQNPIEKLKNKHFKKMYKDRHTMRYPYLNNLK